MKNYLKDGNLKIDNNLAENAIRPLTLSRKNFLFCGNHEAAENTAIICSLLATCKAQEINPREWLNDVIAKLPYYLERDSGKNVRELLPDVIFSIGYGNQSKLFVSRLVFSIISVLRNCKLHPRKQHDRFLCRESAHRPAHRI